MPCTHHIGREILIDKKIFFLLVLFLAQRMWVRLLAINFFRMNKNACFSVLSSFCTHLWEILKLDFFYCCFFLFTLQFSCFNRTINVNSLWTLLRAIECDLIFVCNAFIGFLLFIKGILGIKDIKSYNFWFNAGIKVEFFVFADGICAHTFPWYQFNIKIKICSLLRVRKL